MLHVRYRDGARMIRYPCLSMFDAFGAFGKQNRPFALASRPKSYRSRPPPYPRLWFGLPAYDTYRENATRSPSVSSSSVDESQPASCCWCRCRPAGVTAETTAVDQPLLQAYRPARGRRAVRSCASVIPVSLCTGEVSVRESDRRCSRLAFCPKRISVGRAHHYRKRMYPIRRFRTKLAF